MDTVGKIYLQSSAGFSLFNHLVDISRTEILAGVAVFSPAPVNTDTRIRHSKMARLILGMLGPRIVNIGQLVEGKLAVRPQIGIPIATEESDALNVLVTGVDRKPPRKPSPRYCRYTFDHHSKVAAAVEGLMEIP
jgi:hypothetical protein